MRELLKNVKINIKNSDLKKNTIKYIIRIFKFKRNKVINKYNISYKP